MASTSASRSFQQIDPSWAWAEYVPDEQRPWDLPRAAHLLRRAALGSTWESLQAAVVAGPRQTVDRLLRPDPDSVESFEQTMRAEAMDVIQVDYALDNRNAAERILPLAADRGMAVLVNLPFGRGRLFQAVQGKPLPEWTKGFDCASWAQFFLKYIVSHPAVTCAVPGTAQVNAPLLVNTWTVKFVPPSV
jgi:hypothetical protein